MSAKKHKTKVGIILGTRPEIIKLSSVIHVFKKKKASFFILHTNQHYSENMDKLFFRELGLPKPKYNLNIREKLHGKMTGRMLAGVEKILVKEKPDWVLVQGDTNTALSGALAATKLGIKVGHVEAGLRSYDRSMPEEINRVLIDHISDALFCPTRKQAMIAKSEGINKAKIVVTGNTIVDAIQIGKSILRKRYSLSDYRKKHFALLTLHRPSNVDDPHKLVRILNNVRVTATENNLEVYFPIHPRTKKNLDAFKIHLDSKVFKIMKPVGFLEMLALEQTAKVILTDSGGVQEEACVLRIPCVTIRDNTERPETVVVGANILVGSSPSRIQKGVTNALSKKRIWKNPFGDGLAGKRIFNRIYRG
jgi:UDP-N-acetylglucosamine 2-epimerase (non-hydrolysing)